MPGRPFPPRPPAARPPTIRKPAPTEEMSEGEMPKKKASPLAEAMRRKKAAQPDGC